ncbi:hypothetical protein GH5_05798 [Leishmania sp. Ghana 2012 LV757]|uniref:hypothetical protein n=1 Tax=Leishmania sp. Ghana 2012 LV757 TaxID=2803181 RepID=UPI001B5DDF15|nr:hypothetical protein GH5_05798 [Leishmania sp. Ghana 2012 LV757]
MPSSSSSTAHSEGIVSSALLFGTQSSLSPTLRGRRVNGSSRRRDRASERPTRRFVEFAEAPQSEVTKHDAGSGCQDSVVGDAGGGTRPDPTCSGDNGRVHRRAASASLNDNSRFGMDERVPYTEARKGVAKDIALGKVGHRASPILPTRPGARMDETAKSDIRFTGSSPAPAVPAVIGGIGGSSTPPASSSFTANTSLSPMHRAGVDAACGTSSVAESPASAALCSNDPLAALSSEQTEAALQLYVERGGVHAGEVTVMLQALPWCGTAATHASLISVDADTVAEDVDEEVKQRLLDPEAWLRAVAAATATAVAVAGNDERAGAAASSAATPVASSRVAHRAQSPDSRAEEAPTAVSRLSNLSDPCAPAPVERTVEKRCNSVEFASGAATAADRTCAGRGTSRGRRRRSGIDTEMSSCSCDDDSDSVTLRESGADDHHVFADRKLAYDDAGNDAAARTARVERFLSLPQLARHQRSGSVQHSQQERFSSSHTTDAREPRSSHFCSSVSPMRCFTDGRRSSHVTPAAFSQACSTVSVAAVATEAPGAPAASTSATASTAAEGMRTLFQYCLQAPLGAASSTLRVSDWHTLLDRLRHDGQHKMPPQPILDDVASTIAHTMHCEGHPGGLTLSDFTRVIQRQLKEIGADMMSLPSPGAAAGDGAASREDAILRFPTHPKYVFTVPTPEAPASASAQATSLPSRHSIRRCSPTKHTPAPDRSQWRVLPTWCMALAGLFPLEMSRVCPVTVVRYLRSVGLIRAVLEAIMQRLQLELDAAAEYVAPVASAVDGATQNRGESTAVESSAWRPQREGSGRSGSVSSVLPLSGASAVVRSPNSAVITGSIVGVSSDGNWPWKERPVWCSAASDHHGRRVKHRKSRAAPSTKATPGCAGGDGLVTASSHPHTITNGSSRPNAGATALTNSDAAKLHYLEQRPLDEISASVVARAKARRVMDTLRRHTVPINRYECFARVEPESEPVQKPMCFVSKEELKAAFSGDGSSDSDDDSDAMPDMVAALTYDPQGEVAVGQAEAAARSDGSVEVGHSRSSRRPPLQSRIPGSNVLPTVMSATRAAKPVHRRAPSGGAGRSVSPPPPAPYMFRMNGLLSTALPRKHEEALVHRLSKPVCDPVAMGRRAASAENACTRGQAVDPTGAIATSDSQLVTDQVADGRPTRSASRPPSGSAAQRHHWFHPYSMHHESRSGAVSRAGPSPPLRNGRYRRRSHPSPTWTDPYYASVCASRRDQPPSPSVSGASGGGACASKLTEEQNRGFFLFDVPSVLAEAPLSSVAAAAAAAQVIASGGAPCASSSTGAASPQPSAAHRPEGHRATVRGTPRGVTRAGSAAPPRAKAKGRPTGDRRTGSISNNAVAKPAGRGSRSRSTSPYPRDAPKRGPDAAHPRGGDSNSRPKVADAAAAVHPPASPPHSQPHVSLYERRLHRQLQLAYANEHV